MSNNIVPPDSTSLAQNQKMLGNEENGVLIKYLQILDTKELNIVEFFINSIKYFSRVSSSVKNLMFCSNTLLVAYAQEKEQAAMKKHLHYALGNEDLEKNKLVDITFNNILNFYLENRTGKRVLRKDI